MRIGIIGCGMIAQLRHAPEYLENPYAEIAALYDALPERAMALSKQFGGVVYDDWKRMIDEGGLDAVSVCSPNATHADISVYALQHGLHVLCEKPMATTIEDCARMVDTAERTGRLLFIGQNQRFNAAHIKARELICSGAIGRVLSFRSSFGHRGPEVWTKNAKTWFYHKDMAAHGAVFDLGIHKLDLISYLIGEPFAQVGAMLGTLDKTYEDGMPINVDDNAVLILRTKGGTLGQLSASWTYYGGEDNATRIYGSKGVLHIFEREDQPLYLETVSERTEYKHMAEMQTNDKQFKSGIIDAFVDDIRLGREATVSGQSVYQAMRAVFGAIESAATGKFVEL